MPRRVTVDTPPLTSRDATEGRSPVPPRDAAARSALAPLQAVDACLIAGLNALVAVMQRQAEPAQAAGNDAGPDQRERVERLSLLVQGLSEQQVRAAAVQAGVGHGPVAGRGAGGQESDC